MCGPRVKQADDRRRQRRFCRKGLISRFGPFPANSVVGDNNAPYTPPIRFQPLSEAREWLVQAKSHPARPPVARAHNPEVGGSNPAPAISKALLSGAFPILRIAGHAGRAGRNCSAGTIKVFDRALWEPGYAAEAGRWQQPVAHTLDDALAIVAPFVDPLLEGSATGPVGSGLATVVSLMQSVDTCGSEPLERRTTPARAASYGGTATSSSLPGLDLPP